MRGIFTFKFQLTLVLKLHDLIWIIYGTYDGLKITINNKSGAITDMSLLDPVK